MSECVNPQLKINMKSVLLVLSLNKTKQTFRNYIIACQGRSRPN
eukprot:UN00654